MALRQGAGRRVLARALHVGVGLAPLTGTIARRLWRAACTRGHAFSQRVRAAQDSMGHAVQAVRVCVVIPA